VFAMRYELYLCVPYGSHSKQRLFPQSALTGLCLSVLGRNLFPVRYELHFRLSKLMYVRIKGWA
jgi:hypothetical protein